MAVDRRGAVYRRRCGGFGRALAAGHCICNQPFLLPPAELGDGGTCRVAPLAMDHAACTRGRRAACRVPRALWIPVISSAFGTGFLIIPVVVSVTRRFLDLCLLVMCGQAFIGILGFWFHMRANLIEPGNDLFDKLVNGAPPMAPLLFPNLVGLALIGLWALLPHLPEAPPGRSWVGAAYAWAHPEEEASAAD